MTDFGMNDAGARFSSDPDALAWARGHVEQLRDRYRELQAQARMRGEDERAFCRIADVLDRELIGGRGCVLAAFDERRPACAGTGRPEAGRA